MTEREAIEELKCYVSQCGTSHPEEIEIAIEALEKQIPKKPIIKDWDYARCPTCGAGLSEHLGDGYYKHYTHWKYCHNPDCLQRLCWESEE